MPGIPTIIRAMAQRRLLVLVEKLRVSEVSVFKFVRYLSGLNQWGRSMSIRARASLDTVP
eukprot:scaffold203434_cov18-Prasinocladus_malaysianus.AAC.1